MPTTEADRSGAVPLAAEPAPFALISDDIVLNILAKLEADPRDWARLSCVSTRLSSLVRDVCCRSCSSSLPSSVVSDLTDPAADEPPGGWAALYKLSVCCPGLLRAGVLLEHSDFGLDLDIGPDHHFHTSSPPPPPPQPPSSSTDHPKPLLSWSLFDDLYFDTVYDVSESHLRPAPSPPEDAPADEIPTHPARGLSKKRKKQWVGPVGAHLASGAWNLSREQGNKLLASRFRGDCLYICDWPGCIHAEEKRKYMLFRGIFKNFKRSQVWRTITDANRSKIGLDCVFCACKETWDLHSAFCLRRIFGFHDDGEPVVRAYVCENGHVSGAWTERPMYT